MYMCGRVSLHGVMAKVVDYNLEVSEFKLQWCYYIPFWTKGKDINPLIPPTPDIG